MASGGVARELSTMEADIQMMCAAEVHLGTKNCDFQMERYVFKRRNDGNPLSLSLSLSPCVLWAHLYFLIIGLENFIHLSRK